MEFIVDKVFLQFGILKGQKGDRDKGCTREGLPCKVWACLTLIICSGEYLRKAAKESGGTVKLAGL